MHYRFVHMTFHIQTNITKESETPRLVYIAIYVVNANKYKIEANKAKLVWIRF